MGHEVGGHTGMPMLPGDRGIIGLWFVVLFGLLVLVLAGMQLEALFSGRCG